LAAIANPGIGVQLKPLGQPATWLLRELRYAVVEALGARICASAEADTEPPPFEKLVVVVTVGVGVTGLLVQVTETLVTSLGTVPDPLETEQV
jgi:hypothetical protein